MKNVVDEEESGGTKRPPESMETDEIPPTSTNNHNNKRPKARRSQATSLVYPSTTTTTTSKTEPETTEPQQQQAGGGDNPSSSNNNSKKTVFATFQEDSPDKDEEFVMRMQSSQAMQFKSLFDVLKDLLTDVNLRFDPDGIKVISLDPGKIGMIHLSIFKVEKYVCESTFYVGVNIGYIYRLMRTVSTGHYLEWRIRRDQPKVFELLLVNPERRNHAVHRVKILDLDIEEINVPHVEFDCVLTMPSTDLQRYIKELSHVSNTITIRGSGKMLQFIASGDMGETVLDICPTPSGLKWIHKDEHSETFEGTYFIKYIERFSRGQVDSYVELFFRQDYPLIMRYQMTIGSIRFCCAPIRMNNAD